MPVPHPVETKPTISTHVLDAGRGAPQAGVLVRLSRLAGDGPATVLAELTTDDDGRIASLAPDGLTVGTYRLEFHLDGLASDFFRSVRLDLRVDDPTRSYHVPLLVAPYGLSTYRGS
jgi:5-hydroxyisourate hydrolase